MKRGFLNSSKAKARTLGPAPSGNSSGSTTEPLPLEPNAPARLLEGLATDFGFEQDPSSPNSAVINMRHTSLPSNGPPDEPVSQCIFYPGSKEVLTELPGFPQPLMHPATPTFCVATFSGKGMGLVSTRALKMGDLILNERPLLLAPQAMPIYRPKNCTDQEHLQRGLAELEKHIKIALERMRPASRAAYLSLANSCKKEGLIVGLFLTNGLELAGLRPGVQGPAGNYSAVCKDISRLNHRQVRVAMKNLLTLTVLASCSPNASTSFDMASFSYRLYAVRDIAAGEELTYQYTDVEVPASERRKVLKGYDFVCACSACKDAPASDARRATIASGESLCRALIEKSFADDALVAKCRAHIALILKEGLEHIILHGSLIRVLMYAHICRSDAKGASEWATKLDNFRWENHEDVRALLDPASPAYKKHHFWGTVTVR
ncbi:hypothetical protein C8F04DRAFT_1236771 [Mycena alexandri]|uniref:SET domain-containing protein n=1 Tax=Mycena alexandri TaxID=1745969 RepID=A0AAD6SM13_9AGAR|nr:hypothetical protein C8F04DRAFT_1236771 [Mycena alexandri]